MASSLIQLHCSTLSLTSNPSILPPRPSVTSFLTKPIGKSRLQAHIPRQVFPVRALTYDGGFGSEDKASGSDDEVSGVAVVEEEKTEVEKVKKLLVDSLYGTDRGLRASRETRSEIVELITQLEALNPTPAPTQALPLLNGKWILAYTSFRGLFPLLSQAIAPFIRAGDISQTIDSETYAVQNSVQFVGPWTTTDVNCHGKYEVRSPKRVQLKIEERVIGTPQLTDSLTIPEEVEFVGQKIDLKPLKGILDEKAKKLSRKPPVRLPVPKPFAESWLLTTYLDEDIRVSRVQIYAEMIGNVMVDARSTGKYYHFVRLMGRAASHITLECALQTHPNITIIGEECLLVCLGPVYQIFDSTCNYEGRCGLPTNFDATYCYALGYGAGALLHSGKTGLILSVANLSAPVEEWVVGGTALTSLMDVERRHGAPFKKFASLRDEWALKNCYISPSPIQFTGPGSDAISHTLLLELGVQA
ncbi:unnamed protein product [Lupinus luteus]|uniref:Plastid lipid-associated protein/fibrillin conserved domain-containing protein n=1 Tax=Lupinus luteus TaxID=3873 RepID=A0AAV1WIP7_LUPLU